MTRSGRLCQRSGCLALISAGAGPGDDVEPFEGNLLPGIFANSEAVGLVVEPLECRVDFGERLGFSIRHHRVQFLLHGVCALVGHVEWHFGEVAGGVLLVFVFVLVGISAEELGSAIALLKEARL